MKALLALSLLVTGFTFAQVDTHLLFFNGSHCEDAESIKEAEESCYIGNPDEVGDIVSSLIEPNRADDIAITIKKGRYSFGQDYVEVTLASYGCYHDGGQNCKGSFRIPTCE